jgi:hypothetical protein
LGKPLHASVKKRRIFEVEESYLIGLKLIKVRGVRYRNSREE